MELMMTGTAEYQRFSSAFCHHLLPKGLSFRNIFELSDMVDLERPFSCPTVFTLLPIEPFDDLRATKCPDVDIGT